MLYLCNVQHKRVFYAAHSTGNQITRVYICKGMGKHFTRTRQRVASFEEHVKKLGDARGSIDLFWKGTLLVEHKSKGKDLTKAYRQALDYFP